MNNPKLLVTCEHSCSEHAYCGKLVSQITLLDLFAGMALLAYIHNYPAKDREHAAWRSYQYAQAMLKERDKIMKGESDAEKTD